MDRERLQRASALANQGLIAAIGPHGHWVGELSSSALSTATAVAALAVVERESGITAQDSLVASGLAWLAEHQNADGGWGDTTRSLSNLSTTALCWAAFGAVPGADVRQRDAVSHAEAWLKQQAGGLEPNRLAPAVIARYGKDRTFSVPILTMCALAGRLGLGRDAWKHVISLPFELAACPQSWFAALRLPVVSYALPALIAIGQARHRHRPSGNPLVRLIRNATRDKTLRVLTAIQPGNGGFLEATPLTSFVTMSLAGSGQVDHVVTKRGVEFLQASQRPDGSWPIDTNLATWVTTLAVNALGPQLSTVDSQVRSWLLRQQYREVHPYTRAAPGGWAWTDLPGGVPDADDTSGALLALRELGPIDGAMREAAVMGIQWLLDVQNRDGGIPTFCRGWGALPFDRSSADITAHAIRAWLAWRRDLPLLANRIDLAVQRATSFLLREQRPDGSWLPLWFGNQWNRGDENPVYGTSRVLIALAEIGVPLALERGVGWLIESHLADGGWGARSPQHSSVEESALAVEALAKSLYAIAESGLRNRAFSAMVRGAEWLVQRVESGEWTEPSPIGFYFAKLWYYERLYPVIFTVGALRSALQCGVGTNSVRTS
jgi:squalene-hopene/tetraprenyl-beta-curcumene cyclase